MSFQPESPEGSHLDLPAGLEPGRSLCRIARALLGVPYCGIWTADAGTWTERARSALNGFSAVPVVEALERAQVLEQPVAVSDLLIDPSTSKWVGSVSAASLRFVYAATFESSAGMPAWGVLVHDVIPRSLGAAQLGLMQDLMRLVQLEKIVKKE